MPLSHTAMINAKPLADKALKISDEKGMFLLVHQNGSKYFRLDYRFGGKRKTLALGVYPETSLKQAREKRDEARKLISDGVDPGINKKAVKSSQSPNGPNCFEVVAREWYSKHMTDKSESHQRRTLALLQRDLFPAIGSQSIDTIIDDLTKLDAPLVEMYGKQKVYDCNMLGNSKDFCWTPSWILKSI